ncbi:MAG TPA: dihydropteroate synthase [Iamia sp.]|nr:dihydropteroate synthase [Iamia sp.]
MNLRPLRSSLRLADRTLDLSRPVLMGVVNANPDSFSDPGARALDAQVAQALALADDGAAVIDVGGQSASTGVPEVDPEVERQRVAPLVAAIAAERPDLVISIDSYKPPVVAAALDAGAHIVNDVSGLRDPALAALVADRGAAIVVMHTAAAPKQRLQATDLYDGDVVGVVGRFLAAKVDEARAVGIADDAIVIDPGPDFTKTPAQTVEVLRALDAVDPAGRPLLLALSRKDFVGALTLTRPKERLAGTLAAIAAVGNRPGVILRVHDVAEVRRFLTVLEALTGDAEIDPELRLADELRWTAGRPEGTTALG